MLVGRQQLPGDLLLVGQDRLDGRTPSRIRQHPTDQVRVGQRALLDRREADQRAAHAHRADHLRRDRGGVGQVPAGAGGDVAEEQLLGDLASHRDLDQGEHLAARAGEHVLAVAVGEHAQGVAALDDAQDLQAPVRGHQVRHRGVPGLVGGDQPGLVRGVGHRLAHADLLG